MTAEARLLDPGLVRRIEGLELRARTVVEGVLSGIHRSPHRGSSVEFAEHREYGPGDDVKSIDWRVWGRRDAYYVKQFEEETNLKGYLVVDATASMGYGPKGATKLDYARTLAASLAYLLLKQQDAAGLLTFQSSLKNYVPPQANTTHLREILGVLAAVEPRGRANPEEVFTALADRIRRRGLLIYISDLLDDLDRTLRALKQFRHRRNDVVVFHVLDPAEIEFPFEDLTLFVGMEDDREVLADPRGIRKAYREEMAAFLDRCRRELLGDEIDYRLTPTSIPPDRTILDFLGRRP